MKRYSNNNRNKNESNWPDSNMHANQQRQYNKQVGRFYKSNLDEKINQTVQQQQKQPHKITDSILKTPVKNEKQKQMHMDTPVKESLDYSGSSSAYDSDEIDENNNNMKNTSSQSLNSTIECGNTSCSNQMGSSCEQTELHNQQLPHPNGGNMMTMMMTPSSEHGIPYGYYSVPVSEYDYNNNMMQTNHVSTPYYHVYQSPYSQNGSTGPGSAPTTAIYYQYSPYMYDPSVIASPQSSSMLATAPNTAYQTPPPTAHHQLYVSANPAVSDSHSPNSAQTSAYCSASTASNSTTNMMTPCSSSMTSASCSATSVMPESSASGTSAVLSNGESPSTTGSPSLHQMLSSTSLSSSSTTAAAAPYAVVYQTPIASTVHQSGYMMYQQAPMRNPYQSHPSHVSYQATPTTTSSMQHVPVYASPTSPYVTPPAFYRDSNSRVRYNRHQKRDYYNKSQMFDSTPQALNFNQTMPGTPYIHQQAPTHYNQSESVEQGSDDLNSTITSVTNNTNPLIETQPVQQAMYSPYDYSMVSPIYQDPCMMSSSGLLPTQMGYNAYGMPVGPVTTPTSGTNTTGGVSPPLLPNYYASPAENFGTQFPLASAFACANEYDTYDENGNLVIEDFSKRRCFNFNDDEEIEDDGDEEKEQLACYVCRGRRMCFCYFLKVRYYKFPSFLDLVDHQYKKWKIGMQRARKAAAAAAAGGVPVATVAQ